MRSPKISFKFHEKKVLLRERKRHTTRRVASARYATLSPDMGRGGTPFNPGGGGGGTPSSPGGEYPICLDLGWGTPSSAGWGTPLDLGWGTPPSAEWHTPLPSGPEMGCPHQLDRVSLMPGPGMGYPHQLHGVCPWTWDGILHHQLDGIPPSPTWTWDGAHP